MTLRLVLISLVAGLGLGLPSWPTIEGWVAGAQAWMNARLAAADARPGERRVIIHDLLAAEMQRAHAARQARRASAPPATPRSKIVAIAHATAIRRHAAETLAGPFPLPLPRLGDFLTPAVAAPPAPPAPTVAAIRPDDLVAMAWNRIRPEAVRLAAPLVEGLREAAARDARSAVRADDLVAMAWNRIRPAVAGPAATLAEGIREAADRDRDARAFAAMTTSDDLYFDVEPEAVAAAIEPVALPAEVFAAAVEGPEPVAIEGPAPEAVDLADLPADVFAPVEAEIEAPSLAEADSEPEFGRAIHLTGQALSAWLNVLTGPALVTVSHGVATTR